MSDEHDSPERVWDEYDWERFLRQQDRKAERYLEMMENGGDDSLSEFSGGEEWSDEGGGEAELDEEEDCEEDCEEVGHPLYQACFDLSVWLDDCLMEMEGSEAQQQRMIQIADDVCVLAAHLASAVSEGAAEELAMTIAYLKRGLKTANQALAATVELSRVEGVPEARVAELRRRLFEIRDEVVVMMGELRAEWRRRLDF